MGCTYYFLCNDALSNRVRLVEFHLGGDITAHLITINSFEFEEALESGLITEVNKTAKFPPWLNKIEGISIAHLESRRISNIKSYYQRVDRRLMAIYDLVQNASKIINSDDPNSIINAHAKSQKPQQNAARLRLWFYTYLVFGRNKWALIPVFHRAGSWDRYSAQRVAKIGRPSPRGKHAGYRCDKDMQERLLGGYLKFRSPYKTHNKIYAEVLVNIFGCSVVELKGAFQFHHPDGQPFPSFPQYKYWIDKLTDRKSRSIAVRGKSKERSVSGDVGSFSERLTNLNQLVEFDGYYIKEKLTGINEGGIVNSYCVVRAVCGLSGMVVGIGFAEGQENMDAYRMCLFSMAADKVKYCELFGITIESREWPSEGLPGNVVFDGGPGASYDVMSQINWLSTLELTPSYSGQSKASIEASHPRHKSTRDQPTFTHSKLNFVTMAKREIIQVLSDNRSSDASGRMDEEMYLAGVKPNPLGIWEYWDSRGRNSAIGKEFTSSIRDFLVPHPATIRKNGVSLYGRIYRSKDLTETGIFDSVARSGVIHHEVYVMTMCVRHIWIDISGVLYELDAVLTHRVNNEVVDITLKELKEINELRVKSISEIHGERPAVEQHYSDIFHQQTGDLASGGKRMTGQPQNNAATARDTEDYKRFMGKAK